MDRMKILVVDDDENVRANLVAFFEDYDFLIASVSSSEEALDLLESQTMDAAVVDLRLPGMDGSAFIARAVEKWPRLCCLIYTGSPEFVMPKELSRLPNVCSEVFLKPLSDLERLNREIDRLIQANQHS